MLGVDSRPAHKSTETSRASHFQFFQYEPEKPLVGSDVLDYAARMYMKDDVNYFIDVAGTIEGGTADLRTEVLQVFKQRGDGLVLTISSVKDTGSEANMELVSARSQVSYVGFLIFRIG